MRNRVLYFPYIELPQSAWLTRILLYWDTVGVIMPYQYIEKPEELDEHTRSLIQSNLVTQVIPNEHIGGIHDFAGSFLAYLHSLGAELDRRRRRFRPSPRPRMKSVRNRHSGNIEWIHLEKMGAVPIHEDKTGDLAHGLADLGLASRHSESSWLSVEPHTAQEFMSYLATVLGQLPYLQFAPVTDEWQTINKLASKMTSRNPVDGEVQSLRLQILEDVLPAPSTPLLARDIEDFKRRHGEKLSRFRRSIELELTTMADIQNPELRRRRLELFKEEIEEELADIQGKMRANNWQHIVLGKLCALLAPIPVVGTVPDFLNAVYNSFGNHKPVDDHAPLAYAAYARRELLRH